MTTDDGNRDDLRRIRPRTTLPPTREYQLAPGGGGPFRDRMDPPVLTVLADFKRGSDQDRGYGSKR